ncbi:MAG: hypothetical protein E6J34_17015 [Chloroflexi bacterium]|nr:MAG: hypothetical protein E6J34_17015 [Chloroflexota bacterium]
MAEYQERIGQQVGDYHLLRWLGGGGFGDVYLAEHIRDHNQVAVKVLQIRLSLRHPHIMPLLDFGLSEQDEPFLVMDYAPKGTLRDRHPKGSRVPLFTVLDYTTQLASALQYAHEQRLVHRDVKPENMLLRSDDVLLLSDFGIATAAYSTHSLSANAGVGGTIPYMAPEQLEGKPRAASDQYALAVVIYEWLTGRCPFMGTAVEVAMQHVMKSPPRLLDQVAGLPQEVEDVLLKALAKDPKERFASVQAMVLALQQASAPPTLLRPASGTPWQLPLAAFPANTIPPSIPPSLLVPPPVAFTPSPVAQGPLLPLVQHNRDILISHEKHTPIPPHRSIEPPVIASTVSATPLVPKPSFSKASIALLVILILLLIGALGSYAWSANTSHLAATATVVAYSGGTATARAAPTATVSAAISAYNTYASQHGMVFGFDAQHTHNNSYERILNSATVSGLKKKWVYQVGASVGSSAPAVVNGTVYVGAWDGKLYAIDVVSGTKRWTYQTNNHIISSPAVVGGVVYIGSWDGNLYAIDAISGNKKWAYQTGGSIYGSSPAVVDGVVYIGSWDGKLYAIDVASGSQKWTYQTGDSITSSPAVVDGVVYVGSQDHSLYAVDAISGNKKWAYQTGSYIDSSPAVADGMIYIGSVKDHTLYAIEGASGNKKWSYRTGGDIEGPPTVAGGVVYISSRDYSFYAIDAISGNKRWSYQTGGGTDAAPAVADGVIYVGSNDANFYAFSLQ